jgi:hypothetical protein
MDLSQQGDPWGNWNWYFTLAGCVYSACLGLSFAPMGLAYFGIMFTAQTMDRRNSEENM